MAQLSEQDRAAWLRERRTGIGGTDAAAILGLSPWSTPLDVWLDKVGEAPQKQESQQMWWGSALEDIIAQRYAIETNREVTTPPATIMRHPKHPILLASVDRLVKGERRGLDCKNTGIYQRGKWGDSGSDDIPEQYVVQCCHYMAVMGYDTWDVAALIGGNELRVYTLNRNADLEQELIDRLLTWWDVHVVGGNQPPIVGGSGVREWIHSKYPSERGPILVANDEGNRWADEYRRARSARDLHQKNLETAELNLKNLIGEAAGLAGQDWRVTWKKDRDRSKVDWEAFAKTLLDHLREYQPDVTLDEAKEMFTNVVPGSRRFLLTQQNGGNEE